MTFKFDPIQRCAAFLILFSAFAFGFNASSQLTLHLTATLGFSLVLFALYSTFFPSKHKNVWDTVITALILFLVLHYGAGVSDLVYPLTASFIAITLKFFVEYKSFPIVNPVAAGLLVSALVLAFVPGLDHPFVSWWGTAFQGYLSLALLAVWIVGGLYQWRRWHIVVSFLVVFALGLLLRGQGIESVQFALTNSMVYFYATIMLLEPKTSPFRPMEQVAYGAFCAVVMTVLSYYQAPYPELFALVAANLAFFGKRVMPKKATVKA